VCSGEEPPDGIRYADRKRDDHLSNQVPIA
jgi:hypothetical protein